MGREERVLDHLRPEPCATCSEGLYRDPETTPQDMKARGGGGDGGGGLLGGLKLGGGGKNGKKKAAANEEARDPEQVCAWLYSLPSGAGDREREAQVEPRTPAAGCVFRVPPVS